MPAPRILALIFYSLLSTCACLASESTRTGIEQRLIGAHLLHANLIHAAPASASFNRPPSPMLALTTPCATAPI